MPLTSTIETKDNDTVVTVTDAEVQKALDGAAGAQVAFSVVADAADASAADARLFLTAAQVKLLQGASAQGSIAFTWNDASVAIPLSALKGIDADFELEIGKAADQAAQFTKAYVTATVLGTPYAFEAHTIVGGAETPLDLAPDQTVRRAFLLDKGIDASKAGALYAEDGGVYPVPAAFKKTADGKTLVSINRPGFSSMPSQRGMSPIHGYDGLMGSGKHSDAGGQIPLERQSATLFSPKKSVTRAEFAAMLANAIGLDKRSPSAPFSDIRGTEWFAQDVAAAYEAGLITGSDGKFRPNDDITRQDLTVMLARAMKLLHIAKTSGTPDRPYADASAFGPYAQDSIKAVTDAGLMQGLEKNGQLFFDPAMPTTREAAAKVLYQLLAAGNLI